MSTIHYGFQVGRNFYVRANHLNKSEGPAYFVVAHSLCILIGIVEKVPFVDREERNEQKDV